MQCRLGQQGQRIRLLLGPDRQLRGRVRSRPAGLDGATPLVQRLAGRVEGPQEQRAHLRRRAPAKHHRAVAILVDMQRPARVLTRKGKKALCAMYQDTDFGKEVLDGVQAQAEKMKVKIVETVTHKPTDQDFSAQVTKLKAAGCDLVVLGTIVRDSIVPYATARKMGWTDVDFLGSAASYDLFVAAAQGGVTEGFYAMGLTAMPYRDTLGADAQKWFDRYKDRYKVDPNIGAIYGHVAADLTVTGLMKTGPELTTDNFVKGLESIRGYRDIFNGPEINFAPDKHQGASSSFLAVVKGGRWVRLTDPLTH